MSYQFSHGSGQPSSQAISKQLTEEELAVFDLLTRPEPDLTDAERAELKKVAHDLLETLKRDKLVIDWRKKQQSRASVRVAVEEQLDRLPNVFTTALWQAKVEKVYQHVYDSYYGEGRSVYSTAAA